MLISGLVLTAIPAEAQFLVKLSATTLRAFEDYRKSRVDAEMQRRIRGEMSYLWVREDTARSEAVLKGTEVVHSITGDAGREVPEGLIHDWVGAVFIPGVSVVEVRRLLEDQNRQKQLYPEVITARTLARSKDYTRTLVRIQKQQIFTIVVELENDNHWYCSFPSRCALHSYTLRVREVSHAGGPEERLYGEQEGHGFLWRMNSWWLMEEDNGGVWVELRVTSLSRSIPPGLGWILRPMIASFPGNSISSTLSRLRKALSIRTEPVDQ